MRLVIVESPAKAKTINKYLGSGYKVVASYGHVRDLLSKDGSVRPDEDFAMTWEISSRGAKCIDDILKYLKQCDELLLATDPDREGEAISWHIKEIIDKKKKLNIPVRRIVFHEITRKAIGEAIENPRDLDIHLVDSYLARRALDYLVGFSLSPILWRKLPGSKSAGRVQSVALRIITEREMEIEEFKTREYWTLEAKFEAKNKKIFSAKLTHFDGEKLDKFFIDNQEKALFMKSKLDDQAYVVSSVQKKNLKRNPAPPFITSTLQQEASRKFGFSAKKTMQLAQNLYEGIDFNGETTGLITYMRTDSINLAKEAVDKIRSLVSNKYGKDFLPASPRIYTNKVKNAQEAHEAIRPVDVAVAPDSIKSSVGLDLYRLYNLIWQRAVASQMSSAVFDQVQVDITDTATTKNTFKATGSTLIFDGFLRVYEEGKDEASSADDSDECADGLLPPLAVDDATPLKKLENLQHFTQPPPRFSEASLVKKLEELGIGRPSTYASILQVLQDRGYVRLEKKYFIPEIRGRLVISFLLSFFGKYLEYGFTADMEQSLDDVSNGNRTCIDVLREFWTGFCANIAQTKDIKISDVINQLNESLKSFLFGTNEDDSSARKCPECKIGELSLKIGKFGSFIGCSRYPDCSYVRKLDSFSSENDGALVSSSEYPKFIGVDPLDQQEIFLKKGPYGLYLEKPTKFMEKSPIAEAIDQQRIKGKKEAAPKAVRISVPQFMNLQNLDLAIACQLLQLPKNIGTYEGEDVKVGIGRFGPFVFFKDKYISIKKDPASVISMSLDAAIDLIENRRQREMHVKKK
ncbi:MAG: type I DNA topoisomerase [Holosporaceae bacterium]|jgi:DNA topoisomerase-1|nr:type I DNA topoisomerase [Holosporaceae bacterium]